MKTPGHSNSPEMQPPNTCFINMQDKIEREQIQTIKLCIFRELGLDQ